MVEIDWLEPRENLKSQSKDSLLSALSAKLLDRVQAAYVFGSLAKGTCTPTSDIDLILVTQTPLEFTKRALDFQDLREVFPRLDLFVYTPQEFEAGLKEESFIKDQSNHWVKIV